MDTLTAAVGIGLVVTGVLAAALMRIASALQDVAAAIREINPATSATGSHERPSSAL